MAVPLTGTVLSEIELDGIRDDVEIIFTDEVRFYRPTSLGTLNTATSQFENSTSGLIYEGPGQVTPIRSRRDKFDVIGEGTIFTRQYRISIPWEAGLVDPLQGVQIRDRAVTLTSRDPQLVGRIFEVRDATTSTNIGYRQITVHDFRE
jgi:hypothetical protein